jgi:hypothetical protein
MQESSAAIKSACAQRSGALRLLLAEQAKELRELEQEKAAAQQLAMDKVSTIGTSVVAEAWFICTVGPWVTLQGKSFLHMHGPHL